MAHHIEQLTIHWLPVVQTKPAKPKFIVVLQVDSTYRYCLCLVINSKINHGSEPENLPCFVPLNCAEYEFLNHDSVISCTTVFTIPFDHFPNDSFRQVIDKEVSTQIKNAVESCPSLRDKHRAKFIEMFNALGY